MHTAGCRIPDDGYREFRIGAFPSVIRSDEPQAYLTQATQSLTHPVPLVAGKPALLRVFVATR